MDRWYKGGLVAVVAGIATVFASVSLWIVFEQDIFWQVRAGEELLRTHAFPWVDTWSYSVRGEPWLNIQWLSTVALYLGYAAGQSPQDDVAGLIALRGVCIAALFLGLGAVTLVGVRRGVRALSLSGGADTMLMRALGALFAVTTLMPCMYTVLLPRLQLRSDLFVVLVFTLLVGVWQTTDPERSRHVVRAMVVSIVGVLVAANLHVGTAPFVLVLAVAYSLAYAPTVAMGLGTSAACVLAFFMTPYTWHVLPILYEHFFYSRFNLLPNTDHLPLTWSYFVPSQTMWGWTGVAWVALCTLAACTWALTNLSASTFDVRRLMSRRIWPLVAALVVFTAMSINRERSIPYHAIFVLPFAALAFARLPRVPMVALTLCAWIGWATSARSMAIIRGGGVHEGLYPVGCAKFLAQAHPQGNVFHTFALGAYLVWYMRDRPLYVDTRETMYRPLQSEIIASFQSPEITQALLRKYDAHTVVMPIPPTRFVPGAGFEDVIARFLPRDKWALVYFDKAAFVSVARIPEHADIIAKHEYTLLRPNLPANLYAATDERTPASDARFAEELTQCLRDEPDNVYCTVAHAAFYRDPQAPLVDRNAAVRALESAVVTATRWNSPQWPHVMVELHHAYEDVGNAQGIRSVEASLPLWGDSAQASTLTLPHVRGAMP